MASFARLLPALLALCALLVPAAAWAQTISLPTTAFEIERENERPDEELPLSISRQDCLDASNQRFGDGGTDEKGDFTWVVMEPQIQGAFDFRSRIEVWISEGADCSNQDERAANGQCSLVYNEANPSRNNTLVLNPRDLVARARLRNYDPTLELPETICSEPGNLVDTDLSIHIFLRSNSDDVDAEVVWTQTSIDLAAPPAPADISVGPGDENLFFEWDIESENEDPETLGFIFYCVPTGTMSSAGMGGAEGTGGDAATGGDTGTGGDTATGGETATGGDGTGADPGTGGEGGAPSLSCGQDILVDGELATAEAESYECGRVSGRTARSGNADKNITNNTTYAVAVAAFDTVGNSGELTVFDECLTPQEVTTFFEGYEAAGGKGGGGFCAHSPGGSSALWWLVAFSAWTLLRRRRRTT